MLVRFTVVKIQSPVENVHNCKKKIQLESTGGLSTGFLLVYIPSDPLWTIIVCE